MFDDRERAEQAVEALVEAGFATQEIGFATIDSAWTDRGQGGQRRLPEKPQLSGREGLASGAVVRIASQCAPMLAG